MVDCIVSYQDGWPLLLSGFSNPIPRQLSWGSGSVEQKPVYAGYQVLSNLVGPRFRRMTNDKTSLIGRTEILRFIMEGTRGQV